MRHPLEDAGRLRCTFNTRRDVYENVYLALRGRHQATNAALAIEIAETFNENGFSISRAAIIEGLENAIHPGRLEMHIATTPPILFDGAHNVAGARALRDFLDEFIHAPMTLVFGAMRDKELSEIAATLFPVAAKIILTQPDNPRAATHDELVRSVPASLDTDKITFAASTSEALRIARGQTLSNGLICVTGSLYLIGEIKAFSTK
jgi:dihydrofolate synthase/folylpolyglutamate synthase